MNKLLTIITGATSGIGLQTAKDLVKRTSLDFGKQKSRKGKEG